MTTEKLKTGTTTIGFYYKEGILLAADKRMSAGMVSSDNLTKVFNLSKAIASTVAGEAASAQLFMRVLKSEVRLLELQKERPILVKEAAMVLNNMQYNGLRSQGAQVSCILAGYDERDGFSLYDLAFDGTINTTEKYLTRGSGSIFAKGVLDAQYNPKISEKEAIELAKNAFRSAFKNDLYSGGGFIIKLITKEGIKDIENIKLELNEVKAE
jgi:20S proteasome alpha/beta subunit